MRSSGGRRRVSPVLLLNQNKPDRRLLSWHQSAWKWRTPWVHVNWWCQTTNWWRSLWGDGPLFQRATKLGRKKQTNGFRKRSGKAADFAGRASWHGCDKKLGLRGLIWHSIVLYYNCFCAWSPAGFFGPFSWVQKYWACLIGRKQLCALRFGTWLAQGRVPLR